MFLWWESLQPAILELSCPGDMQVQEDEIHLRDCENYPVCEPQYLLQQLHRYSFQGSCNDTDSNKSQWIQGSPELWIFIKYLQHYQARSNYQSRVTLTISMLLGNTVDAAIFIMFPGEQSQRINPRSNSHAEGERIWQPSTDTGPPRGLLSASSHHSRFNLCN